MTQALADKSNKGHGHEFAQITNKPDAYPSTIPLVQGLQDALDDTVADWDGLTGKPTEFPPESHTHSWGSITSKPAEFPPESHSHTPGEVGLGNVDNTADADKPISTAQQAALAGKADVSHVDARPAMWLWDGQGSWTAPAAANDGDSVLNLNSGEIHSITEV